MKKITLMLFALVAFYWQSSAQLSEDFETDPPTGWSFYNEDASGIGWIQTTAQFQDGAASFYHNDDNLSASFEDWMISPSYTVVSGDELRFWYRHNFTPTYGEENGVWISTTGSNPITNPGDYTLLYDLLANASEDEWTEYIQDLSSYVGQTVYIAFKYKGDWEDELYIDTFSIAQPPACSNPSTLDVANIMAYSADLSWTETGTATTYNIELVDITGGGTQTMTATQSGVSNPYTYSGLVSDNDYEFYVQAICGGDLSDWIGPFSFTTLISCYPPTNAAVSGITTSTADFTWLDEPNGTLGYELELGALGFTPGNSEELQAATANPTDESYSFSGLTEDTAYDIYIRSNCDADGYSAWEGPYIFYTLCAAIAAPYAEDFETFTVSTAGLSNENCWNATSISGYVWEVAATTDTSSGSTGPASGVSDGNYLFTEATSGSTGDAIDVWSPLVDLSALTVPALYFDYHMYGADMGTLEVIVNVGGTETVLLSLVGQQQTSENDPFETEIVDLSAYSGQTIQIIFRGTKGADYTSDMSIDNISFDDAPSCFDPSDLMASNVTNNSAILSWTENGSATTYNIELVDITAGGNQTMTATETGVSNSYDYSGLTANNDYEYYVQAICGSDLSAWVGPYAFSTVCDPFTASYYENFDTPSTPNLPDCWSKIENTTSSYANVTTSTTNDVSEPNSIRFYNSGDLDAELILVTPMFSDDFTQNRVRFSGRDNDSNDIIVGTITDPTDAATFTEFQSVTLSSTATEYSVNFDTYTGSDAYIAFKMAPQATYDYTYIDDFNWEPIPSCIEPSDLTASNIMPYQADLSWTENGSASSYNVEVVLDGETPTGTPTDTGVVSGFTKTGLTPTTDYQYYVQADCTGGDLSAWAGPFSFTTPCDVFVPDYTEDFTTFLNPCWEEATGPITGPTAYGSAGWTADGFANDGTTGSARFNIYSTGGDDWLITPTFDLSAGGYELNMDVALTAYTGTAAQTINTGDAVYVMQSIDGGATWTPIYTWDDSNSPSNTGDNLTIDIAAITSSTVQFAIYALEDDNSGGDMNFYVDNFKVRTPLACAAGSVDSSAVVDDCANAQFYVDVDITIVGDATQISDGTNTYPISGTGITQVGPFVSGSSVTLTVEHSDSACDYSLGSFSYACPPSNDECIAAEVLSVENNIPDLASATQIAGTIAAASDSGITGCAGTANDDVWFSFVATSEDINIDVTDDFDGVIELFSGECGSLVSVECDDYDATYGNPRISRTDFVVGETYYLRVFYYYGGTTSTPDFTIALWSSSTLSTNDFDNQAAFTYYPNPVKNTLTLNAQNNIDNVVMYNMLGQEVLRATPNTIDSELDMSQLNSGTYFVQVTIANTTKTVRVIKQ
ncbi:MAG: hypothetical protein CMC76_11700 [Flavobacteriaceae bacterium]|nr:hypothetical protein [Flavobacteriaceae bacterium]